MKKISLKNSGIPLLFSFFVCLLGISFALPLHWTPGGSFSPWTNYISDLSVGLGGSDMVFILMIASLATALALFFIISYAPILKKFKDRKNLKTGTISGLISSLVMITMLFFPLDRNRPDLVQGHIITATILFFGMAVYLFSYSLLFLSDEGLLRYAGFLGLAASFFSLLFAVLLPLVELAHIIKPGLIVYLIEWTAFGFITVWFLLGGWGLGKCAS